MINIPFRLLVDTSTRKKGEKMGFFKHDSDCGCEECMEETQFGRFSNCAETLMYQIQSKDGITYHQRSFRKENEVKNSTKKSSLTKRIMENSEKGLKFNAKFTKDLKKRGKNAF